MVVAKEENPLHVELHTETTSDGYSGLLAQDALRCLPEWAFAERSEHHVESQMCCDMAACELELEAEQPSKRRKATHAA